MVVPFAMLLNLVSVSGAEEKDKLWGFIQRYALDATPEGNPDINQAAGFAIPYYNNFVKPHRKFRLLDDAECAALEELVACLQDEAKALDVITWTLLWHYKDSHTDLFKEMNSSHTHLII